MTTHPDIIYLGRSRLHRSRANLIQTLHTASGFEQLGWRVRLHLPPWPRRLSVAATLREIDVDPAPEVVGSQLLHPRWHFWPFVWRHRRALAAATVLYTRAAGISAALARANLVHHLEIHNVQALHDRGHIERIIAGHGSGLIQTLIPISHSAAQWLIDAGAVRERIHVAHSGVKLAAFSQLSPFDPDRLDKPRIVHLGQLSQPRGLLVFQHLAERGGYDITIVSRDESPITNVVRYPPVPMEEVPSWYARSDVTLLPYQRNISTAATMSPIKMFEAMAAGRPILASDLPTVREVLEHERTALLVQPDDCKAWVDAIERLRRDRSLAVMLARNALAESRNYSWVARAEGIADAIGLQH